MNGNLSNSSGGMSSEERLESLKRQFGSEAAAAAAAAAEGDAGNGLGMNLQDQYSEHEAEQQHSAKRQRGNGNNMMQQQPPNEFDQGVAYNNMMNGGNNGMGNHPLDDGSAAGMNSSNGNGGGGGDPNNSAGAGMNAGMNGMGPGGPNHQQNQQMMMMMNGGGNGGGMNPMGMAGMNGMGGMNAGMNMNMNQMGMNQMNMAAAARAGMLGGMGGPGSAGYDNDMAAALYLNSADAFQDPRTLGLLASQRAGAGLGFMPGAMGGFGMGGMNMAHDYRSLGGNPYAGLSASAGFPHHHHHQAPGAAGAMGAGAASMGLPGRRAQIMALMDMENERQQQQQQDHAGKVTSGGGGNGGYPGGQQGMNGAGPEGWAAAAAAQQRSPGVGGPGNSRPSSHDGEGLAQAAPTQIPEPPMDIPTFSTATTPAILPLPPVIEEGAAPHYSQRTHIPLGIDEDNNWLTEFQCFIRFDLIEVVQASRHVDQANKNGGGSSNSGETFQQCGVRCRYCAHLHPGQRASRSSAFPSSIRQLYQSFTMMLRDHFEQCSEIPVLRKKLFSELKSKNSQGAYDSKQYWIYAAEKLGMVDSEHGIQMTSESQAEARRKAPFGSVPPAATAAPPKLLVSPDDLHITSSFLYTLMSQVQVVHLIDSERVGKRKTLRVGLPGFGCRYCCHVGRCGLSRMFPLRRRMLPGKVSEIHEHFKRCTLFPTKEKERLARLKVEDKHCPDQEKEFFDRIWERLGCESEVKK